MQCPKCGSQFLMIKQNRGVERLMVLITGLRDYLCQDCNEEFRAPDRRKAPRAKDKAAVPHRQTA